MFSPKKLTLAACTSLLLVAAPHLQAADVTGAGASFPAPIYAKWADAYQKATGNKVNYQSIGSSGGVRQIKARTVDFGASDAPMQPEMLEKEGLQQFPTVVGGVVPVINVPGIQAGELKLTGALLADIFLGKIDKWNNPAIAALNPGLQLPATPIAVVRRADGSGTSFIFTNYLSKVSPEWKSRIGEGSAVQWPTGVGGKGNEGVSAFVQRLTGAIGYVESAYAKQNKLTYVALQNREGIFVQPTNEAFKAAAASADWNRAAFYEILTDQPGEAAWPITGATFILMHKVQDKPAQATETLRFFSWAYENGGVMAEQLDYVPLPAETIEIIKASWGGIKGTDSTPIFK